MQYQGMTGKIYSLDEEKLASGGEGIIYKITGEGYAGQVAKIFKPDRRSREREEKLCMMVQKTLTEMQLRQIAWPQDVLYELADPTEFVGYVMPKVENTEPLVSLYSDSRYKLQDRLLAAINLCAVMDTVHEMGQVCGDLNPQNICINVDTEDRQNGLQIMLVDADSYHFVTPGKTYRCEVGLAEYLAPEIQRKLTADIDLKNASLPTYTQETDLFALAVHIFELLMNGCHPFACAKETAADQSDLAQTTESTSQDSIVAPQPIDNIKNGFFPFYEKRAGITHPIYAPAFESLPEKIRQFFVQVFVEGNSDPSRRIAAEDWKNTLWEYRDKLVRCEKGHEYFKHNAVCPVCVMNERQKRFMNINRLKVKPPVVSSSSNPGRSGNGNNPSTISGNGNNPSIGSGKGRSQTNDNYGQAWTGFKQKKKPSMSIAVVISACVLAIYVFILLIACVLISSGMV